MFEKEAEEYVDLSGNRNYTERAFKDGAEFGYKLAHEEMDYLNKHWGNGKGKANEWHYVKDGDLPKENKICLLYLGGSFNPITGWIKDGIWYFEDDRKNGVWQINVIAWKEIVLPKESE